MSNSFDTDAFYNCLETHHPFDRFPRDNETVSYDPDVALAPAQRMAIAEALQQVFEECYGVMREHLSVHFSSILGDGETEYDKKQPLGLEITPSPILNDSEQLDEINRNIHQFNNDDPVQGFRTFQQSDWYVVARSWEDVVGGLNKRFEKLGSDTRINTELVRSR